MVDTRLNIFIGYDERETDVYKLCEHSIKRHCSNLDDLTIVPLNHRELRSKGLLDRPWRIAGQTGQYLDERDGRPFSTQFSHSRFLTPYLAKTMGMNGHAMFVDCDFIFKKDVTSLFEEAETQRDKAVSVVKHSFTPAAGIKMDGMVQLRYQKKLWSALMIFNLENPFTQELTPLKVNHEDGSYFHHFLWANSDDNIGSLNEKWNWIPDHSEPRVSVDNIGAIHYTEGGPWFPHLRNCKYDDIYWQEKCSWIESEYKAYQEGTKPIWEVF